MRRFRVRNRSKYIFTLSLFIAPNVAGGLPRDLLYICGGT